MNITNLPLLYLKHLFEYLNSLDQINLLKAIHYSVEYKQYLFNHNKLNLTNCFKLKSVEFKELSKFYTNINELEDLNLNFCYNLSWKSITNQMTKLNLQMLTSLNVLSIKIDFKQILNLITNNPYLKELSFSLNESPTETNLNLNCFIQIQVIRLELNVQTDKFLTQLLNSLNNVIRLEIFSSKKINKSKYIFSFNRFSNKFVHLRDLVVLKNTNILFDLNEINQIVSRLIKYSLTFTSNVTKWYNYIDLKQIKCLKTMINKNINNDDLFENAKFEADNQVEILEIDQAYNVECILTVLPFRIEILTRLIRLDLKNVHIHSVYSICEVLSSLNNLKELFLPCCSLACDQFKTSDTRYLFKRIIDEDEETDLKNKQKEPVKQLKYLVGNKLVKFGLYSPKLNDKTKDKQFYHCRNVDSDELKFIGEFSELKQLHFQGFKYIGNAVKFEKFLSDLSSSTHLTHFNLIDFNSFITFEYQTKLINQLVNFKYLQQLCIDQVNFYITKKLIENISCLTYLKYLKLFTKTEDKNMVKNLTFHPLVKLENLILFYLKCKLTKNDLILLKKQLKNVLSNTIFVSVNKSDQETTETHDIQPDNKSLQLITISNTTIKYKHDINVLNFLNESE